MLDKMPVSKGREVAPVSYYWVPTYTEKGGTTDGRINAWALVTDRSRTGGPTYTQDGRENPLEEPTHWEGTNPWGYSPKLHVEVHVELNYAQIPRKYLKLIDLGYKEWVLVNSRWDVWLEVQHEVYSHGKLKEESVQLGSHCLSLYLEPTYLNLEITCINTASTPPWPAVRLSACGIWWSIGESRI